MPTTDALVRRFSETRRPHPLGQGSVLKNVQAERKQLEAIRDMADQVIVTSDLTSPQLRKMIGEAFAATSDASLRIAVMSFGFPPRNPGRERPGHGRSLSA